MLCSFLLSAFLYGCIITQKRRIVYSGIDTASNRHILAIDLKC